MFDRTALEHPWLKQVEATLFLQHYPRSATDDELKEMLQAIERLVFSLRAPYAWIVDLGGVLGAPASQRRLASEHEDRTKEHDARFNAGSAILSRSAITTGIITAIFWLSKPSYPTKVFSDLREAERWSRAQIERARRRHRLGAEADPPGADPGTLQSPARCSLKLASLRPSRADRNLAVTNAKSVRHAPRGKPAGWQSTMTEGSRGDAR